MELEPVAKPVKFRIVCDGREHSTISSLRDSFSITDIEERIKDGSLKGFFRQEGKGPLSEKCNVYQAADILFEAGGRIKDEETLFLWWKKHGKNELFKKHFKKYLPVVSFDDLERFKDFHSKELKQLIGDEIHQWAIQHKANSLFPNFLELSSDLGSINAKMSLEQYRKERKIKEEEKKRKAALLHDDQERPKKALVELTRIVSSSDEPTNYNALIAKMRLYYDFSDRAMWNRIPEEHREYWRILLSSIAIGSYDITIIRQVYEVIMGRETGFYDAASLLILLKEEVKIMIQSPSLVADFNNLFDEVYRTEKPVKDITRYLGKFFSVVLIGSL